jgi:type VI secretion system secreted protein VgrG
MTVVPLTALLKAIIGVVALAAALALGVATALPAAAGSIQPVVGLATADSYEVLSATTVTNTGPTTLSNGDVGLHPGTAVTGFPPAVIANGVIHAKDAQGEQAKIDLTTAYNDAAGRVPDATGILDLAGQTLVAGVYSGNAVSLNGTVTLDGGPTSVFIFQAASTLITGSASTVAFTGGANACNVFWQVGSSATLGSASVFAGTIMAMESITAVSGATIEGRLLARNGAVTLDSNVITRPAGCAPRSAIVTGTADSADVAAKAAADAAAITAAADAAAAKAAADAAAAAAADEEADNAADDAADDAGDDSTIPVGELARTGIDVPLYSSVAGGFLLAGALFVVVGNRHRPAIRAAKPSSRA